MGQLVEKTICESPEDVLTCMSLGRSLMSSPYSDLCSVITFHGGSATVINSSCQSLGSFIFPSLIRTIPSITHTCLLLCLPTIVSHPEGLERDLKRALALVGRRPLDADQELEALIVAWETKYGLDRGEQAGRVGRLRAVEEKLSDEIDEITEQCERHRRRVSVLSDRLSEVAQFGVLSGGRDKDEVTRQELAESRQARKELAAKLDELEGVKTEIEADRDRLAVEAGAQRRASDKLREEVTKYRRSLEAMQQQMAMDTGARAAEETKLIEELEKARGQTAKAESALEEAEKAHRSAVDQAEALKVDLSTSRGRVMDLESQLSKQSCSFQKTIEDIRREHELVRTELEAEIQLLRREVDEHNRSLVAAADKASQLEGTVRKLREEGSNIVEENNQYRLRVDGLVQRVAELTQLWQESEALREDEGQRLRAALRLADEKSHDLDVVTAEVIALRSEKNSLVEELSRLHTAEEASGDADLSSKEDLALARTDGIPMTSLSWASRDITMELEEAHHRMKAEIVELTEALAVAERAALEAQEQQALTCRLPLVQRELLDRRTNWCQTDIAGCKLRLPEPSKSFDDFISQQVRVLHLAFLLYLMQVVAAASCVEKELLGRIHFLETASERAHMSSEDYKERARRAEASRVELLGNLLEADEKAGQLQREMEESVYKLALVEGDNKKLRDEVFAVIERLKTTEELHKEELACGAEQMVRPPTG
ncbi:merozoite surface protein-3, putative [Perkinsus marinus ATCC 50983]|uniref:Merozoite surface protein-3, putative n=1 Tax=Perkinsus marinus (strain ATCC 50983 / TXsc) TaxID=423536 RepID=C5LF96_PERM5|nr:merozoite surface protein-3, putative [Perkinsus marinus ATCC 50983]EER04611.1 merozoite surface protein-3, putative [Perkinsus marinus ATCC 50983]|eukprot:XP_002772795.1 merozoite surface protein-3, putative [Perkinsus marinus ATCC 50983]